MKSKATIQNTTPLYNRVFIERIKPSDTLENGLYVHPGTDTLETFMKGKILAKGPDCTPDIAIGDIVMFRKTVGSNIKVGSEEVLMVRETEIDFVSLTL